MAYLLSIVIAGVCALMAEKKNSRKMLFFTAVILSLFCGLRSSEVGVDTVHYYSFLSDIRVIGITYGSDIGFSAVSYFLMNFFKNPHTALLVFAVITNSLIIYRFWDFRNQASFPLMVFIYSIMQYPYTFNIVRQFLAIAVVFWATRYISKNKYLKYIVLNIIAVTLHTSALICFVFLFVGHGFKNKKTRVRIIGFVLAVVFVIMGIIVFGKNSQKYMQYFAQVSVRFHPMTVLKILSVLIIIILNRVYNNSHFSISKDKKYIPMDREIVIMYQGGLLLAALGMLYMFMNRMGFYFMMFEMPFWGQAVRAVVNRGVYRLLILVILIYVLISTFQFDTSGLITYSTYVGL